MSTVERVARLEHLVVDLGDTVLAQAEEIRGLKRELDDARADMSLDLKLANWRI